MLRRDGTGRSWVGKDERLTQVERKCREIIDAALMKKGQWSSTKAMGNYLHGNDAGKRKVQLKRIAKRGTRA